MEFVKLDFVVKTITVTMIDGTEKNYTDRATYLLDWPDRAADCDAMGWANE